MNKKNVILLVIVLIAIGAYFLFMKEEVSAPVNENAQTETSESDYVGMSVDEAEAKAESDETMFRVVVKDGEPQPTTRDFQEGRINAVVENNVVIGYSVETQNPVLEDNSDAESANRDEIIGMTEAEAQVYAENNGVDFRIGTVDGVALPVTLDFRPGRITAEVESGVVVGYTTE